MKHRFHIDADIRKAHTLPTEFYTDPSIYERVLESAFPQSWQWVGYSAQLENYTFYPITILPDSLAEPLLLSRQAEGDWKCLSNVCTHRGNLLIDLPTKSASLRCRYHGRCFYNDGRFKSMPEFKEAENFPSEEDHLTDIPMASFAQQLFVSLAPLLSFEAYFKPIIERMNWLPLESLVFRPENTQEYQIDAHWALYCDNYLEGFHIPFVHPQLNQALDYSNYDTELFEYGSLQLGIARDGETTFEIPETHPDFGKGVYAYYFWMFPNMMFNFYTWGLSVNVVEPVAIDRCKVTFYNFSYPHVSSDFVAEAALHQTEMEDEAVVQNVQRGIRSRFYRRGRFSPKMEKGVHHFHRLLASLFFKDTPTY